MEGFSKVRDFNVVVVVNQTRIGADPGFSSGAAKSGIIGSEELLTLLFKKV